MKNLNQKKVLIIEDPCVSGSAVMRNAVNALTKALKEQNVTVSTVNSYIESYPLISCDTDIDAVLLAADLPRANSQMPDAAAIMEIVSRKLPGVPLFLLADRAKCADLISADFLKNSSEFIWIFEDSPVFISGRIMAAIWRYRQKLLPPLFKAIADYNERYHEYSWAAPGHQGGRGFTKNAAGKKFYDFYDENLFRTDTGIERSSIGSLLDHTGAFEECERFAAKTFGADISYSGVVGTSGSNRTVIQAAVSPGECVLCDRNCHKSIEQGMILTGAKPIYFIPSRNAYGIIGPIPRSEMTPAAIAAKLKNAGSQFPHSRSSYAVVTNCTYDGLCYNAAEVEAILDRSSDRIHFDEAWYGYARFNPLYSGCFAMRGNPADHRGATIFATHSTHKLLTALSQASFIHVRNGRRPISFDRFNQAYMMHTTTSPLYAICASNDISAKVMADSGRELTREVIDEAIEFRQALARISRDFARKGEWFFDIWNTPQIKYHNKKIDFADAPAGELAVNQEHWWLDPKAQWHGFKNLDRNWVMLDPIKVSILAPGISVDGELSDTGVPAALVAAYLYREGIIPTRSTDFQLMFLFSVGITKGKWVTLLNALLNFKQAYDANVPLENILPEIARCSKKYRDMGLRTLGERMFEFLKEHNPTAKLNTAYENLPPAALIPRDAYSRIVENEVETVPIDQLSGRISATAIIPYPPGIPMLMSGERFGGADCVHIAYLRTLADWDAAFPGFEHETEGCIIKNGIYHIMCVKE